ncbi:MAG: Sec-independent protein translocase protein TatB [Pseudomonadota bacterium]
MGWTEILVIAIVALVVVGPTDFPKMYHAFGKFTARARQMAREFSRAMDDAARESGVGDAAKGFKDMASARNLGLDSVKKAASGLAGLDDDPADAQAKRDQMVKDANSRAAAGESSYKPAEDEPTPDIPFEGGTETTADAEAKTPTDGPTPADQVRKMAAKAEKTARKRVAKKGP